jgi:hypothetical protein
MKGNMNNHQESYSKMERVAGCFSKIYGERKKEEKAGGRGQGRGGKGWRKGHKWESGVIGKQQWGSKQLDPSSVINTGLRVMVGIVGVRIHLISHLRHIHILRVPVVRIAVVRVRLRLVRHDVRVQTRVLHAIVGSRISMRRG